MGIFDKDPKYQQLKKLRDSGYKGGVDEKGRPTSRHDDIFKALDKARDKKGGKR